LGYGINLARWPVASSQARYDPATRLR
jgi:hypothetical protein